MADDFFADLLPMKPKSDSHAAENGVISRSPFSDDAVLSAGAEPPHGTNPHQVPNLLGPEPAPAQPSAPTSPMQAPMGGSQSSRVQKEVKEFEAAVEVTMKRFAAGLQRILEDVNRRLESLENQTERLGRALSDARDVDSLREEGLKERFNALDKGLRDVSRGVQLVRDKQELIQAQAELAKFAVKKSEEGPLAPAPSLALSQPETAAVTPQPSAPAPVSVPGHVVEAAKPTPPPVAAPLPEPTVPPMTQTPPYNAPPPAAPAAPQPEPQKQYSAPQYSALPPPTPPAAPAQSLESQQFQDRQQYSTPQQQPSQPLPPQYSSAPPPQPQNQAPPQYSAPPQQPPPPQQYSGPPPQQAPPQQYSAPQQPPPPQLSAPPPQAPSFSGYGGSQYEGAAPPPPPPPPQEPGFKPFSARSDYGAPPPQSHTPGYPQLPQPSLPNAPPPSQGFAFGAPRAQPPPSSGGYGYPTQGRPAGGAPPPPPPPSHIYGGPVPRRHEGPPPPSPGGQSTSRNMPLEQVIDDVANMGFSRHDVRGVVSELMDKGQAVDLNIVLDRLMNGPKRH